MKKTLACFLILTMILLIAGCGAFNEPLDISGEWVATNGDETITYNFSTGSKNSDGIISGDVRVKYPDGSMNCSYEIDKNENITVYTYLPMSGKSTLATFHHSMKGEAEVLKDSNGLLFFKQNNG